MGASKAALILMKNSHFDRTLQYKCPGMRDSICMGGKHYPIVEIIFPKDM